MPDDAAVSSTALHDLSITEAARLIEHRRLSPVDLTQACLDRIEAYDPQLNAYLLVTADRALDQARAAEAEITAGRYRGPLHGIPFALKDIYCTAGIRTTCHSRTRADYVPDFDATTVTKLYDAGAVLLGKLVDPRIRAWRPVLRPALAAGAQSLEPRALHRRLVQRLRRRRRGRPWRRARSAPTPAARSATRPRCAGWSG